MIKDMPHTELVKILEGLLAAIDGTVVVIDKECRILLSNWKGHTFITPENHTGRQHCYDVFKNRSIPCEFCPPMDTFSDGQSRVYEDRNPVDGTFREIHVAPVLNQDGDVVQVIEYIKDVSAQKQAEEILRLSKDQYKGLFDYANDAIIIHDLDGNIVEVNQKARNQFAYPLKEFLALKIRDLYPADALEKWQSVLSQISRKGFLRTEIELKKKNHRAFSAQLTASLFQTGEKKIVQLLIRDISQYKQAEKERSMLASQLNHALKMEALGCLAGGVAHDLNNLLCPIIGFSELLLEDLPHEDARNETLYQIHHAALGARDLIRQLLAFSRKQALEFKALNINRVLANIKKLLRRSIREDIDIKYALAADVPPIQADCTQLEQVIINLAVNAQDAMVSAGRLSIATGEAEFDEAYVDTHDGAREGHYVLLAISDTGCGIEPENIKKIFNPFFTTKEKGRGTGLGLATVYGIVKQHGGNIGVHSEPGKGTTFKIYLPAIDADAGPVQTETRQPPVVELCGTESIMVVEDNETVRNLAAEILNRQGYRVHSASGARECLADIKTHQDPIELLLTDVVMPEMNGKELYNRMKNKYPDVKVLFMSGYAADVITHHGILDKGVNFIQKPFSVNDLILKVRQVLSAATDGQRAAGRCDARV